MSPEVSSIIIALIAGLTGSGGCSIILYLLQRRDKKKDGQTEEDKQRDEATKRQSAMLLGLGHDRIVYLGSCYVERGYITQDEYENLHDYLRALSGARREWYGQESHGGGGTPSAAQKQGGINP